MGVKPLLLLLATRLAKKPCLKFTILDKTSVEIGSLDEASYATCHMSGIPMDNKSISKWPVNFVRPVEVYWKLNDANGNSIVEFFLYLNTIDREKPRHNFLL